MSVSATPHSPKPALSIVEPDCTSATASSALSHSFDFERSTVGALSATALMLRICFVNRQCGGATRAARNCEGTGRRAHNRAGRAASSLYEDGSASIVRCDNVCSRKKSDSSTIYELHRLGRERKRIVDVRVPLQNKSRATRSCVGNTMTRCRVRATRSFGVRSVTDHCIAGQS